MERLLTVCYWLLADLGKVLGTGCRRAGFNCTLICYDDYDFLDLFTLLSFRFLSFFKFFASFHECIDRL